MNISEILLAATTFLASPDQQECVSQLETGTDAPALFTRLVEALDGDPDDRSAFAEQYNFEDGEQLDLIAMVAGGKVEISEYLWCFDDTVAARLSTSSPDNSPVLLIDVIPGPEAVIEQIALRARPPAASPEPISPEIRADVLLTLAETLQERYIIPDVGDVMARQLRRDLAAGRYDRLTSPQALALRLTEDLKRAYTDRHLRIYAPEAFEDRWALLNASDDHEGSEPESGSLSSRDITFEASRYAYLKFEGRMLETVALLNQIGQDFSDALQSDGVILDLRGVPGGDSAVMQAMSAPFYSEATDLLIYQRLDIDTGEIQEEVLVTPGTGQQHSARVPLLVLIDELTGSAAESLAFALKRSGRARVVGERSAGAGHLVTGMSLDHGFGMDLPIGRAIDPRTGDSWEAIGVMPDLQVDGDLALPAALQLMTGSSDLPQLHSHS